MTPTRTLARVGPLFKAILPRFSWHRISGQIPQDLFPTELWDAIFHEVSLDRDLLRISTVYRTFNLLCIRIFPARNNCSAIFSSPDVVVLPHLLDAFHLSLRTFPQLQRFVCELKRAEFRRDLEFVRGIMTRAKNLRSLALHFREDLFDLPIDRVSQRALMSTFSAVLSDMAQRTVGPVFIFSTYEIFSCLPRDIAGWNLDIFQFNRALGSRGMINRVRRALHLTVERPDFFDFALTRIQLHTGKRHGVFPLTSLKSATIESIAHDSGRLRFFVLLVFNVTSIQHLYLSFSKIAPEDLSAIIMHVSLPYLSRVDIDIVTLDSLALRFFLSRHPTIETIRYNVSGTQSATRPMVNPPLEHPGLKEIHVEGDMVTGLEPFSFPFSCLLSSAKRAGLLVYVGFASARATQCSIFTSGIAVRTCLMRPCGFRVTKCLPSHAHSIVSGPLTSPASA
ncbi:hypothetical protein B0H19DRAFT_1255322 [Mycena capillaripes]|nr:hypothetical protein B0H19DRAFT_1255322 [Mycena capillaripes]